MRAGRIYSLHLRIKGTRKCNNKSVWNGGGEKAQKKRATHVKISQITEMYDCYERTVRSLFPIGDFGNNKQQGRAGGRAAHAASRLLNMTTVLRILRSKPKFFTPTFGRLKQCTHPESYRHCLPLMPCLLSHATFTLFMHTKIA